MNIKLITKAMHTLSLLSEDDVQMVMKLRGLSEDERQMLMLVLEPGTKPSKKSSKKSAGGGGRSKRGESLKGQLDSRRQGQRKATADDGNEDDNRCLYKVGEDSGGPIFCDTLADNNVHHLVTDPDYHEFQPPTTTGKSDAQSAAGGGD